MTDPLPPIPISPMPGALPVASAVSVDASGIVVVDRSCRQCGYNVRGLHVDRQCPECGAPVAVSARGDALEFCEPKWVKKLSLGAGMLMVGPTLVLLAIVGFFAFVFVILSLLGSTRGNVDPLFTIAACSVPICFVGGAFITYLGAWYVTSREPLAFESRERSYSRSVVRLGLVMAILSPVLQAIVSSTTLPRAVEILLILISVPIALVGLYAVRHYYRWIGELARRIPDPPLDARCRMLSTWVPIGLLPPTAISMIQKLTVVVGRAGGTTTFTATGSGGGVDALIGVFGCATCFSSVLLFFLMFVALRAQHTLRRDLREAERRARGNWDVAMFARQNANPDGPTSGTART